MGAVRTVAMACSGPAVDMNRLYVTGFSFGGECTYGLALSYPGVFAAAMPVASFPPPPQFVSSRHPGAWWHIYNAGDYRAHGITPAMLSPFVRRVESLGGEFRSALSGTITVKTGFGKGGNKIGTLHKGVVEVSFDGQMWKRRGRFSEKTGECELKLRTDVIKFIRILPESDKPQTLAIREIAVVP